MYYPFGMLLSSSDWEVQSFEYLVPAIRDQDIPDLWYGCLWSLFGDSLVSPVSCSPR